MKRLIQIIFIIPFIFFGCSDSTTEPKSEYVKGDISFTLKASVDFQEMINTVFSLGEIYQIKANLYESSNVFPEDSIQYIQSIFAQYNFIDTSLTSIKFYDNKGQWEFYLWIRGFKEVNISQWGLLKNQFNMIPISDVKIYGLIKIEEGKESYWINRLKETELFDWVDYTYIANIGY